jgi:hypothetical protein
VAVRLSTAALVLLLQLPLAALAANQVEQTITPIPADTEQRIEPLAPSAEQHVEVLEADGVQRVAEGTAGPVRRGLNGVAKVAVGVLAAGVSLGVMVASLLLL